MRQSFELGRLFGLRLRVHPWLVWFLVALVSWRLIRIGPGAALQTAFDLVLLAILVVWHELAHALVARRLGVRVLDITLWPLGGMARLEEMPEDSRIESWIAAAGPIANLLLGLLALPCAFLFSILPFSLWPATFGASLCWKLVVYNAVLGLTNLLPAFPMDGGRVLRAQLARRYGWLGGTERAVRVSRVLAAVVLALGLFWNVVFIFLGLFLWWASAEELRQVRLRHEPARHPLAQFFDAWLRGRRGSGAPAQASERAAAESGQDAGEPAGPRSAEFELHPLPKKGFSEADIQRLERFHGRLPRTAPRGES